MKGYLNKIETREFAAVACMVTDKVVRLIGVVPRLGEQMATI